MTVPPPDASTTKGDDRAETSRADSSISNSVEVGTKTKKRVADRERGRDDPDSDDDDKYNGDPGSIPTASAEVLGKRRMIKVARKADGSVDWSKAKKNPFASVQLDASNNASASKSQSDKPSSVFGSNAPFTGFGSASGQSKGFGSSAGSGFGFGSGSNGSTTKATTLSFGNAKGFGAVAGNSASSAGGFSFGVKETESSESPQSSKRQKTAFNFSFGSPASKLGSDPSASGNAAANEGEDKRDNGDETSGAETAKNQPAAEVLPTDYKAESGEENEIVLLECRCKTHRWATATSTASTDDAAAKESSASSLVSAAVPPATNLTKTGTASSADGDKKGGGKAKQDDSDAAKGEQDNEKEETSKKAEEQSKSGQNEMSWHEVGIGPLRVLQSMSADAKKDEDRAGRSSSATTCMVRLVQRRQVHTSSAPTKVLLNMRLFRESTATKPGERHVQFTTPDGSADGGGAAATVLFKCGKAKQATELYDVLQKEIPKAVSCFESGNKSSRKDGSIDTNGADKKREGSAAASPNDPEKP